MRIESSTTGTNVPKTTLSIQNSTLTLNMSSLGLGGIGYDDMMSTARHGSVGNSELLEIIHEFCMPFLALITFLLRLMCIAVFSMPIKFSSSSSSTSHSAVQSSSSSYHHNNHHFNNQWSGANTAAVPETSELLSHGGSNHPPQHQHSRSSRSSHSSPPLRTSSFVVINRYLRVNSIFEAFISFTYMFLPFFVYCRTIECQKPYLYKWIYVYIIGYGTSFSSMVSIAANCFLCFYRYLVIFNKRYRFLDVVTRSSNMFIGGLILACAIINLPFLFAQKITNNDANNDDSTSTSPSFRVVAGDAMRSSLGQILVDLAVFIRLLLILIFLVLNLVLLFSSVRFARRKRTLLGVNRWRRRHTTTAGSRPSSILITNLEQPSVHENVVCCAENETIASSPEHNQPQSHQTSLMVLSIPETASLERKSTASFALFSSKSSISNFEVTFKLSPQHHSSASSAAHPPPPHFDSIHIQQSTSSSSQPASQSEWNLTKMTLLIAFIYLLNMLSLGLAFVYDKLNQDHFDGIVAIDLIASNFIQVTNLFEIISYFIFNKCFSRNFKILMRKLFNFFFRK